jgi:hypothetical protein
MTRCLYPRRRIDGQLVPGTHRRAHRQADEPPWDCQAPARSSIFRAKRIIRFADPRARARTMLSYHVHFSPKAEISDSELVETCHSFLQSLKSAHQIESYRLLHITNPASFQGLPRFQLIVDYVSQQQLDDSFAFMSDGNRVGNPPHGRIMKLVSDFRVSFSQDV